MMPRIEAAESMLAATRGAVGSGSLKRHVASDITRRWQRQAAGPTRRQAQKATPGLLQAMGIAVTLVPTTKGEA